MLTADERRSAATGLLQAIRSHVPIVPLSTTCPSAEVIDAYEISRLVNAELTAAGDPLCGHKVGLTSRVMQEFAGIDEPDYGYLRESMFVAEGSGLSSSMLFRPLVEAEIAFVLKADVHGPRANAVDVIRATDFVLACLEIVDSRFDQRGALVDTIADNASSGAVVLGSFPATLNAVDLRGLQVVMRTTGSQQVLGSAKEVMGSPVNAVAWLANKLHEFGDYLAAGQIVLSGSFVQAIPIAAGDTVSAVFDHFGEVSCTVAES